MASEIDLIEVDGVYQPIGKNYYDFCDHLKEWANAKGIPYDEIDVMKLFKERGHFFNPKLGVTFLTEI